MRPLQYDSTFTVRANSDLRAAIEAAAALEGASASEWVRAALAAVTAPPAASKSINRHAHVPAENIAAVWPEVSGWLAAACSRPGCDETADSLRGICERQEGVLLLVMGDDGKPAAAGVTQVRQHESGAMSTWVLALGGRRVIPWSDVIAAIEERARMVPCSTVEFMGRPAWARILPGYVATPCEAGAHYSKTLGH